MKKSALKPSTYRLKKVAIRRRSKKTEALYAGKGGRRAFVKAYLSKHRLCQIAKLCSDRPFIGDAVDVHEKISRSAMGAIVPGVKADMQGQVFFAVCRECHSHIHSHPKWAKERGFLV